MTQPLTSAQRTTVMVAQALYETVLESGRQGAPAGPMYAAVMPLISLEQFQAIMGALLDSGRVRLLGHVYYATECLSASEKSESLRKRRR